MNNFSERFNKKAKEMKGSENHSDISHNENYSKNEDKKLQNADVKSDKIENVTNLPINKRGSFVEWEENWKISDNPILEELESLDFAVWINEKGDIVLRDLDTQEENIIQKSNISMKISSLLGKKVYFYSWKDSQDVVSPLELVSIVSKYYKTDIKKRFFYKEAGNKKKWYLNIFTPTEYMNYIEKHTKEPKTILKLINHLVNYKEDRLHYFLNWLAYYWTTFKRPQTAIVFKGVQGAGKGVFANEIIKPLFGDNQVAIITNDILENKFKANIFENKSFYIFEETSKGNVKSNKDIKEFIKQVITNEIVPMDEKHKNSKNVTITAPSIFFTNEVKFLEIEPSDRRFSVFLTGNKLDSDTNFLGFGSYEALKSQIQKELKDFAGYLYNYKIDTKLANNPMETAEKRAVMKITTNSYQEFLMALKDKEIEFFEVLLDDEEFDGRILFNEIETAFNKNRIKKPLLSKIFKAIYQRNDITPHKLNKELQAIDPEFMSKNNTTKIKGDYYIKLS